MQIEYHENLELKARNSKLINNIKEFETKNETLNKDLLFTKEKYKKLLEEFEEIKKDRDEEVLRLRKEVESQKSELTRAHDEIKANPKDQGENRSEELLEKSRSEVKDNENLIKILEACNLTSTNIIRDLETKNETLNKDLLFTEEKYEKLLEKFEEIKNEKKDRDEEVLRLKKEVESQKSELTRAHDEIKANPKDQGENRSEELLEKSRSEVKEIENLLKILEAESVDYKNQRDQMEKKCKILRNHNEILSRSASISIEKTLTNNKGQSNGNDINENLSRDEEEEPLIDPNEMQESQQFLVLFQNSHDEMMSKDHGYGQFSQNESSPLREKGRREEIEIFNTNLGNLPHDPELCQNFSPNSQFSCDQKIENAGSEEQESVIEFFFSATHNLVCRWIDVEINFIQVTLMLIVKAVVMIKVFLIHLLRHHYYQKWKVVGSLKLSSRDSSLFSIPLLWISSLLTKTLLIFHMLSDGIINHSTGQESQCNYELINSDEPASDQEISHTSKRSSISLMGEEEIKQINSPHHSHNKLDLSLSSHLSYWNRSLTLGRPPSSYSNSSFNDCENSKVIRSQKLNPELASISKHLGSEISLTELLFRIISLFFLAPIRTGVINKRSTRSSNSNLSLLQTRNTSSPQYDFSILSTFIKLFSEISADSFCGKPSVWLTMIQMFIHLCVYTIIYSILLTGTQPSIPQSSYYAPASGYAHLHGWAHQLHFSEQWASKLELFTLNMITFFGVQVKNFPIPG